MRRITIAQQLSASPAVRAGLAWFSERFAKHTQGALTQQQIRTFEAHLIDYAAAQFAGIEPITEAFDLRKHTMQVAVRHGMLDGMVRHAAAQLGLSWPDGLPEEILLVVDIEDTQVKGRYNAEKAVVWPAV